MCCRTWVYTDISHIPTHLRYLFVFVQIHNSQNCMKNKFAMVWGYKIEEWRRLLIGTLYQPFVMERNSYAIRMKMIYIHWAESFRCINCVCVCVRACVIYVRGAHCAIAVLWSQLSWMYRTKKKNWRAKSSSHNFYRIEWMCMRTKSMLHKYISFVHSTSIVYIEIDFPRFVIPSMPPSVCVFWGLYIAHIPCTEYT